MCFDGLWSLPYHFMSRLGVSSLLYCYYHEISRLKLHGGRQANRLILLTPNEGLSHQHLEEFRLSGIESGLFSREGQGLLQVGLLSIIGHLGIKAVNRKRT